MMTKATYFEINTIKYWILMKELQWQKQDIFATMHGKFNFVLLVSDQ